MDVIRKSNIKYGIQKIGKNQHRIIKVLKDYDNEEDAVKALTMLMTGEITEAEILGEE